MTEGKVDLAYFEDSHLRAVILIAGLASLLSFLYFYNRDEVIAYGDAVARLIQARKVFDDQYPDIVNLGTTWLPIPQIFMIGLVWNDLLFHTGIAGAAISMVSYLAAAVFLYKLVVSVTSNHLAGIGGVVALTTPNMLYMQSVPMSEAPFIACFVMCVYFLTRSIQTGRLLFTFFAGMSALLATLTRYEGWVLAALAGAVLVYSVWQNRAGHVERENHFLTFALLPLSGIAFWLFFWNFRTYRDPLYFARSAYSAKEINARTVASMEPSNIPEGNLALSTHLYGASVLENVGWFIVALTLVGVIAWLKSEKFRAIKLAPLLFLFPPVFYVVGMFEGIQIMMRHPDVNGGYWNLRFGLQMVPAAGFYSGYLVHVVSERNRYVLWPTLLLLAVWQAGSFWQGTIITRDEGLRTGGSAGQEQRVAASWLAEHYDGGLVLMAKSGNDRAMFYSGLPLSIFIWEGDRDIWRESLENPSRHVRWVFMRVGPSADGVAARLQHSPRLTQVYGRVFATEGIQIYRLGE